MRARPDRAVSSWAIQQGRFLLSVITIEEVWFGLSVKPSARLERWLDRFVADYCETADVTPSIARQCAELRAQAKSAGTPRTQADMLIAATAREHEAVLATRNTRDFEGCGIRVLNPFSKS
jgi:predicted nucleic acid-binding protein